MKAKLKRVCALMMVAAMCASLLAACGSSSSDDEDTTEEEETTEETEETEEETEEEESEEDAEAEETEEEEEEEEEEERTASTSVTIGSASTNFVGHFDTNGVFSTECGYGAGFLIYDYIMYIDPTTGERTSDILTSWDWSEDDETMLVLTLRDDVYFSNGDQMTAEDLLYTLLLAAEAKNYGNLWAYVDFDNTAVSEDDPLTLNMKFTTTVGTYLTMFNLAVYNESWIEDNGGIDEIDWFDPDMICGSGPYEVTEFTEDVSTTFQLRDDWWMADSTSDDYCSIETITILQYSDSTTLMVDYETGALDAVMNITDSDVDSINEADGEMGTVVTLSSNCVSTICLGVDNNDIFDSMNLREAICLGTDADSIAEAVYGSLGASASSSLPTTNEYYVEGYTYEYDLEAAQEALQAYYDESGTSSVELTFIATSGTGEDIATLFQSYMELVGITIDVSVLDQGTAVEQWLQEGTTDFLIGNNSGVNSDNDASSAYEHLLSTDTFPAFARDSEELNDLLNAGLYTVDTDERAEVYAEVQEYLYENYELIPISEWQVAYAYNDTLSSMSQVDVTRPNLRYMAG